MTQIRENCGMPPEIFNSRSQLVRLCHSLTGDGSAAEDLAQETLIEAWRCRDSLRDCAAAQAWLAGIARNLCRRHVRRVSIRHAHASIEERAENTAEDSVWERLEQEERAALLDRAMGLLPENARALLAAKYWEEQPLAEIAARANCQENTAAVRLGRAREALRGVLAIHLTAEAAAFGLVEVGAGAWRQTRVWCFRCGQRRLEERAGPNAEFGVRCPQCDGAGANVAFSTQHAAMDSLQVLGSVRAVRPALRRINSWWDTHLRRGLHEGGLPCWRCAETMDIRPTARPARNPDAFQHQALFRCRHCGADFSLPASGLAFHSAAVQRFWQRSPHLRVLPERHIGQGSAAAVVTRYEAIGGTAAIEIVYDAMTFQQLQTIGDVL